MVGFDNRMHEQMDKERETVTISNCEIRPYKIRPYKVSNELEVIVRSGSTIQLSSSQFQVPEDITGLSVQCYD